MVDPTSRLKILDVPVMAPGKCVLCGSSAGDRQYIDFGFEFDWYGVVYFCSHCMSEMSAALNFVPIQKLKESREILEALTKEHDKLVETYKEYKNAVWTILRDCNCHVLLPDADPAIDALEDNSEQGSTDSGSKAEPDDADEFGGS